jgi:hypothetical protein
MDDHDLVLKPMVMGMHHFTNPSSSEQYVQPLILSGHLNHYFILDLLAMFYFPGKSTNVGQTILNHFQNFPNGDGYYCFAHIKGTLE